MDNDSKLVKLLILYGTEWFDWHYSEDTLLWFLRNETQGYLERSSARREDVEERYRAAKFWRLTPLALEHIRSMQDDT